MSSEGRTRRAAVALGSLLAAAALATSGSGCEGRATPSPEAAPSASSTRRPLELGSKIVAELDLSRGLPEVGAASLLGPPSRRTHVDFVRTVRALEDDESVKGVFVRLGGAGIGLSRAYEVGRLLGEGRKRGLPVVCHADDYDNGTLLLAAAGCSKLWLSPAGSVDAVGIAAQLVFANQLLQKLHVGVDFLQVGKYKGAAEPFTRDAPSPEARESVETALRGVRAAWLQGLTEGRSPALAEAAEDGPFTAEEAKAKGLVDAIGYADDARDDAKKGASAEQVAVRFGPGQSGPPASRGVLEIFRAIAGASQGGTPHVAVVRAVGAISMSGGGPFGGADGITERELGRTLGRLTTNQATKAVVLRIDSPGGSALASDILWKRLMKLRADKPLVVSVGGMAASGGYYLSCAGTKILAEPTSIVGSIGVVAGKLALGPALAEIGVHTETIAASPDPAKAARSSYMSPFTPWDDATRGRVLAGMTAIYDLFLKRISEGRGMPVEKVASFAEGRLFAGADAKERGMVDELGGLTEAVKLALELAKLPADAPVDVVGGPPGLIELLEGNGAESEQDDAGARAAAEAALSRSARDAAREALLGTWASAVPEAEAFLGSMAPFIAGERYVLALPYVLHVR